MEKLGAYFGFDANIYESKISCMKRVVRYILCLLLFASCQSQTNLMDEKFDSPVGELLKKRLDGKDLDTYTGLNVRNTSDLDGIRLGEVKLQSYTYPDAGAADYSSLSLFTKVPSQADYLGFKLTSVNQEESVALTNYLKKTYASFEDRSDEHTEAYIWDLPALDAWMFLFQSLQNNTKQESFKATTVIFVKRGTYLAGKQAADVPTLMEQFDFLYPKK